MQLADKLKSVVRKIRSRPLSPQKAEVSVRTVFRNVLGRSPNAEEIAHWVFNLCGGTSIRTVESALRSGDEYEQKRHEASRRLVDLGSFKLFAMTTDPDVGNPIIVTRQYEPHVASVLSNLLKSGNTFLDVGANIGFFSMMAASAVGPRGRVLAFEPNTQNLRLLYASIVENQFDHVRVYPFAASDAPKILSLQSFGSNGFLGAATKSDATVQYVQSMPVDRVLGEDERVDVIKMDIEGYEPLALGGLRRIIQRFRPMLFTEFSPWHIRRRTNIDPREYLKQLIELGYTLSVIDAGGSVAEGTPDGIIASQKDERQHFDLIARFKPA